MGIVNNRILILESLGKLLGIKKTIENASRQTAKT